MCLAAYLATLNKARASLANSTSTATLANMVHPAPRIVDLAVCRHLVQLDGSMLSTDGGSPAAQSRPGSHSTANRWYGAACMTRTSPAQEGPYPQPRIPDTKTAHHPKTVKPWKHLRSGMPCDANAAAVRRSAQRRRRLLEPPPLLGLHAAGRRPGHLCQPQKRYRFRARPHALASRPRPFILALLHIRPPALPRNSIPIVCRLPAGSAQYRRRRRG